MQKQIKKKNNQHIFDHKLYDDIYMLFNFSKETSINLKSIISFFETNIPRILFKNVDAIYISKFSKLKNRGVNGLEDKGAIYITDDFKSEIELVKRILHEATHAYLSEIPPSDGIIQEFNWKKEALLKKVRSVFNEDWTMEKNYIDFMEENIQAFNLLIQDLFVSPYASVNNEEYIASGVEVYFLENKQWLKEHAPNLFEFIEDIIIKNMEVYNGSY